MLSIVHCLKGMTRSLPCYKQRMDRGRFAKEQWKDDSIHMLVDYLDGKVLPEDTQSARKIMS